MSQPGTIQVERGMAEMLKGCMIMDVVLPEHVKVAPGDAGAVAVMALERFPAAIRVQGNGSRMSDPDMIGGIINAVSIPVIAKARIGHFVEAQVTQSPEVLDYAAACQLSLRLAVNCGAFDRISRAHEVRGRYS